MSNFLRLVDTFLEFAPSQPSFLSFSTTAHTCTAPQLAILPLELHFFIFLQPALSELNETYQSQGCSSAVSLLDSLLILKKRIAFESKFCLYLIVMLFSDSPATALNNQDLGGKKKKRKKKNRLTSLLAFSVVAPMSCHKQRSVTNEIIPLFIIHSFHPRTVAVLRP